MRYVCRKARNNFAVVPGTTFIVILDGSPNDKVGEKRREAEYYAISQIQ
jgi:hypothetical protein